MSSDWYLRLEQGRDVTPSISVLEAISGALELSSVERAYLFRLARREAPPQRVAGVETVLPTLSSALARLVRTPAFILGRRLDLLAWNAEAARIFGDPSRIPEARRNLVRMSLLVPEVRAIHMTFRAVVADTIAALRIAQARHAQDPSFAALIDLLARRSATFRKHWRRHDVHETNRGLWTIRHATGVVLRLSYDSLLTPDDPDQRLLFFSAADLTTKQQLDALLGPVDAR